MTAFKVELKHLITLAWPLLIAQVTQTLMGVSDTIMAGRYSATDMAAVAIGFSITIPILSFVQGLALAIPPIVARLQGANEDNKVVDATFQAAYIIFPVALFLASGFYFTEWAFSFIEMETELRRITVEYVQYILLSLPAFALYQIFRNYCEGLGYTKPTMIIMALGLLINIPANYVLIYGHYGFPEMGGVGSGLASALVYLGMCFVTGLYVTIAKRFAKYRLFVALIKPNLARMWSTFTLGLPIALTILFEVTLFGVVALLLSPLGPLVVASHQIALNFSALMFMFPLSLGMATTIRVGYFIGKKDAEGAKTASFTAIALGLGIALFTASMTVAAKETIASFYSTDIDVLQLATSLMLLAAMFQLSDAVQAISAGALRGYKDTTAMFLITFVAYWGIGLPSGVVLALTDIIFPAMGAKGFWLGFIIGLTSAAVMLGIRLRSIQRRLAHQ